MMTTLNSQSGTTTDFKRGSKSEDASSFGKSFPTRPGPKFLVIEGTDNQKVSELPTLVINKTIAGITSDTTSWRPLRSGSILVEVKNQKYVDNLLKTTAIQDIPVRVTPHRSLNTCRKEFFLMEKDGDKIDGFISQLSRDMVAC